MRRVAIVFVIFGTLLGSIFVSGADGAVAQQRYATTTTALPSPDPSDHVYGQLTSSKNACLNARAITVRDPDGRIFGKATSARQGDWQTFSTFTRAGTYTAHVAKRVTRRYICKDTTKSFNVI